MLAVTGAEALYAARGHFFGPLKVNRALLPVIRTQRSEQVVTTSSTAGIVGAAYAAAKVRPGRLDRVADPRSRPVRHPHDARRAGILGTDLLTPESTTYAEPSIDDDIEHTKQTVAGWTATDGRQGGDPAKLRR